MKQKSMFENGEDLPLLSQTAQRATIKPFVRTPTLTIYKQLDVGYQEYELSSAQKDDIWAQLTQRQQAQLNNGERVDVGGNVTVWIK